MSLEAMEKVTASERSAQQHRAGAAAQAKKLLSDAEKAGLEAVESARREAEAQAAAMLAEAEKKAQAQRAAILEKAKAEAEEQRSLAQPRLKEAAKLIVRRVVSG